MLPEGGLDQKPVEFFNSVNEIYAEDCIERAMQYTA